MTERAAGGPGSASDFMVGEWLVQPSLNRITRGGDTVRLRPQLVNLLACLASRPAQTVSREEILAIVWPGQYIADTGLARCIAELRQALGDSAGQDSRYIETIPKRGYRLIAPVGEVPAQAAAVPAVPPAAAVSMSQQLAPGPALTGEPAIIASRLIPANAETTRSRPRLRWRRPFVAAACVVIALVGAFLAWRSLRPSIVERDTLVITFANRTGEAVFDDALRLALSTQLEQSPALRVVSEQQVRQQLAFMSRPADTPLTRPLALEVCQRAGAKALVAGFLAPLGRHYAVGLEAVGCESGEVIGSEQIEAPGKEQVLTTLGDAISALRERLGESMASIRRYDAPIAQVTTGSLDALKAFSQGDMERARGNDEDAVRFYRRAIELDPLFALAHVRLGLQLGNLSHPTESVEELKRAYELRDRVSEGERLYITAFYHVHVLRDQVKGAEWLESWRDSYPKSAIARFTLASIYGRIGRFDDTLTQVQEALRLEPGNAIANVVLMEVLMRLGRVGEARTLGEAEIAKGHNGVHTHMELAKIAFELGDRPAVHREFDWAAANPDAAPAFLELQAAMAACSGKVRDASRLLDQRIALAAQHDDDVGAASASIDEAIYRAFAGQVREVVPLARAGLGRVRRPETLVRAALAVALSGDADLAQEWLREYERLPEVVATSDAEFRPAVIGLIAIARGVPESALDALAPMRPYERGWWFNYLPAYVRGLAFMRANRPREAAAEFERIISQPGGIAENPLYVLSRLQLGRARVAAGDAKAGRAAYEQFLGWWKDADADLPVLVQARNELARLQ